MPTVSERHESMRCYPPEEIEALKVLARRSDVLRADGLDWED